MFEAAAISNGIQTSRSRARMITQWLLSGTGLLALAAALCWLEFFNALRGEWDVNPQYGYGYFVPFLGLALLWRRWPDRPVPSNARGGVFVGVLMASLLALVLPFQMILQANPEWRLIYWLSGLQVVGLGLCLFFRLGGRAWARHFCAPLLFMLVSVPWPMEMETGVIQGLMRTVAALTVEVAGWLGIPAVQHGNLIEVGAGLVGIDEACSGVRSLQSALMLSLFLGELNRFRWRRRIVLLVGSLLLVLVANLVRTSFLVWAAASRGMQQMEHWHDTAGLVVMLIVLPGLVALAYLIKSRAAATAVAAPSGQNPAGVAPIPRWPGVTALVWIVAAQVAIEAWYETHETKLIENPRWSVAWPTQSSEFKKTELAANSLAILRCSDSDAATWQDEDGNLWSAFLLRWDAGKNSVQLAKGHRPEICFPAAGARLVEDFGRTNIDAGGIDLPFRHETFTGSAGEFHVFYCLWSDKRALGDTATTGDNSRSARLRAVLQGQRHLGQQVLEIVIKGPDSRDEAAAALKEQLPKLIRKL